MSDTTWDGTRPAPTVPPERAILTDLIAELRKEPVQCSDPYCACPDCPQEWILTEADRAEARLKGLNDE